MICPEGEAEIQGSNIPQQSNDWPNIPRFVLVSVVLLMSGSLAEDDSQCQSPQTLWIVRSGLL